VGLDGRRAHTAAELSGGEQQRVAVARAIAKRPIAVVADESTAQLDSETAAGIMELLREIAATGTAVLMATHDRVAVEYAHRVANMEDGRLAATSTTKSGESCTGNTRSSSTAPPRLSLTTSPTGPATVAGVRG
jgi:ABC-type lipoprotein export system ATPase subunit